MWIPSAIKKGKGPDSHHVYQVTLPISYDPSAYGKEHYTLIVISLPDTLYWTVLGQDVHSSLLHVSPINISLFTGFHSCKV